MTDFPWQSTSFIGGTDFRAWQLCGQLYQCGGLPSAQNASDNADTSRFNLALSAISLPISLRRAIEPWHNLPIVGYLWFEAGHAAAINLLAFTADRTDRWCFQRRCLRLPDQCEWPDVHKPSVFLTSLASSLGLFWWLIAIVKSSISRPVNVTDLWQSLLWLGFAREP